MAIIKSVMVDELCKRLREDTMVSFLTEISFYIPMSEKQAAMMLSAGLSNLDDWWRDFGGNFRYNIYDNWQMILCFPDGNVKAEIMIKSSNKKYISKPYSVWLRDRIVSPYELLTKYIGIAKDEVYEFLRPKTEDDNVE